MQLIDCFAVPGNGGNAARWAQLPSRLAADTRLHPVVLPGFDFKPLPSGPADVATFATWLREDVAANTRPDAKVVVFGTGVGASIALEAAQQPDWCDALILLAPVGPSLDSRLIPKLMRPPLVRTATRRLLGGPVGRFMLSRRLDASPDVIEAFCEGYRGCDAFSVMFDILDAEWFTNLQPITTPSALWWGGRDGLLDPAHAKQFKDVLPTAQIEVLESWGHYPMFELPDEFATKLADACRSLS